MTIENIRRLHLWYGIALAVLTAVVGILFISQAADIYYGGEGYSRELVIERCTAIAAPFWIWVAAIIAGGVLWMIYPPEQKKLKRIPDAREDADRLYGMCAKSCDKEGFDQAYAAVRRERRVRGIVWIVCMALCLVCAGAGAYFAFNLKAFPEEPNEAILDMVKNVLPCAAAAFLLCCGATIFDAISAKKILPEVKKMLALAGRDRQTKPAGAFAAIIASPYTLLAARIAVLAAAIALIVLGVLNGGMADVLGKAINICTECIGLG